jgi:hypothetical protein
MGLSQKDGRSHLLYPIPSGKLLHNYGKSTMLIGISIINGLIHPFSMGKSTISTGPFSIAMLNYQRVLWKGIQPSTLVQPIFF